MAGDPRPTPDESQLDHPTVETDRGRHKRRNRGAKSKPPVDTRAWLFAAAPVVLIFVGMFLGGADNLLLALLLSCGGAILLFVYLAQPEQRLAVGRVRGLPLIAGSFGLVIMVALLSLGPWAPIGPHPVWTYVPGATGATTVDRGRSLAEVFKLLGLATIFLVGTMAGASDDLARRVRIAVISGGALFAFWALLSIGHSGDLQFVGRLTGGLASPNATGTFLAMMLVLSLPLLGGAVQEGKGSKLERAISAYAPAAGLIVLFGVCLVFTASRGAIASAVIAVLIYFGLQAASKKVKLWQALSGAAAILVAVVGVLLMKGGLAIQRLGEAGVDAGTRETIFRVHWQTFLQSPWMGFGLGSFDAVNNLVLSQSTYAPMWNVRSTHNAYLQWLEEAGALGAVPMFVCIASIIAIVVIGLSERSRRLTWLRGLLAVDAVVLLHGMTDFALQVPAIAALWALLLGLQLGTVSRAR